MTEGENSKERENKKQEFFIKKSKKDKEIIHALSCFILMLAVNVALT